MDRRRANRRGLWVHRCPHIALKHWKRLACDGAYLHCAGSRDYRGMSARSPGRTLLPCASLRKVIYIIQGEGVAEIQNATVCAKYSLGAGSLFSPPPIAHRLM